MPRENIPGGASELHQEELGGPTDPLDNSPEAIARRLYAGYLAGGEHREAVLETLLGHYGMGRAWSVSVLEGGRFEELIQVVQAAEEAERDAAFIFPGLRPVDAGDGIPTLPEPLSEALEPRGRDLAAYWVREVQGTAVGLQDRVAAPQTYRAQCELAARGLKSLPREDAQRLLWEVYGISGVQSGMFLRGTGGFDLEAYLWAWPESYLDDLKRAHDVETPPGPTLWDHLEEEDL